MNSLVELRNISKNYTLESGTEIKVLDKVNLQVLEGEVVALLGASGSGKSTCLRIMCGLVEATSGEVLTRGRRLFDVNDDIAMVFQSFALLPWETVLDNIALALDENQESQSEILERTKKAIDLVGLEGFEEAYPRELSGGMKQRVGIARALVMNRPLLFLDEPFSALDVLTAETLRSEVIKIFLEKKTATQSIVIVTHNINEAVFMAKRILIMGSNPGHIKTEIVNDLAYPRDDQSQAFRQMVMDIHCHITETLLPDKRVPESVLHSLPEQNVIESLPKAQLNEVIGLLEAIRARGGSVDIFLLAREIQKDFGSTLHLVKAAEILNFVETPKQLVFLTELGSQFLAGDINLKKAMLHDQFGYLKIVHLIADKLKNAPNLTLPFDDLLEVIEEVLPNENAKEILQTLISWGRFSEYFGYSDDTKEIYLDIGQ